MKILLLAAIAILTAPAKGALMDRLLLEVNKISYSQRQFEVFTALQSAAQKNAKQRLLIANKKNWLDLLTTYTHFVILEQEAMRLNNQPPAKSVVAEYLTKIHNRKETDLIFKSFLKKYNLKTNDIKQTVTSIARVEAYIRGRKSTAKNALGKNLFYEDTPWFKNLLKRTPYRFYEGAKIYKKLTFETQKQNKNLDL